MARAFRKLKKTTKTSRIFVGVLLGVVVVVGLFAYFRSVEAAWYSTSFPYRVKITIDHTKVASDLTNFPVYVDLANMPASFFQEVQASGADIRVTTDDGLTEVPREVVSVNTASSTGELYFKAPTLSSTSDTSFYIYYGNPSATEPTSADPGFAEDVWTNGFAAVWHMNQANVVDSTANGNDGTAEAGLSDANVVEGLMGKAVKLDGVNDRISIPDDSSVDVTSGEDLVLSLWIKTNDGSGRVQKYGGGDGYALFFSGSSVSFRTWSGGNPILATANPTYADNLFHYVVGVRDQTANTLKLYFDGLEKASISEGDRTLANGNPLYLGSSWSSHDSYIDGSLGEVRISSVARSAGWVSTSYNNQSSPANFYTVGSQVEARPSVSTSAITSVTTVTAQANGSITDTGPYTVTERGFVYALSPQADPGGVTPASSTYPYVKNETGSFATSTYSLNLTGLSSDTTYYIRAYAENDAGYSYGSEVSFTTDNAPPSITQNTPTDGATLATTTPTLKFTGTDSEGNDLTYQVQLDESTSFDSASTTQMLEDWEGQNFAGWEGATSKWNISTTNVHDGSASVTIQDSSSLSSGIRNMNVSFGQGEKLVYYAFISTDGPDQDGGLTFANQGVGSASDAFNDWSCYKLNMATEGGKFKLIRSVNGSVTIIDSANISPPEGEWMRSVVEWQTDGTIIWDVYDSAGNKIAHLQAVDTTFTSGGIGASQDDDLTTVDLYLDNIHKVIPGQGPLIDTISASSDPGFTNLDGVDDTDPYPSGDKIRYTVQSAGELTEGNTYYWRVRTKDPSGSGTWSSWSTTKSFDIAGTPSAPNNLSTVVKSQSIELNWTAPSSVGGAAITDYVVEYQKSTGGTWTVFSDGTGTSTTATVTGLSNDTSYDFRVSAVNAMGQGPWSSVGSAAPGEPAQVLIQNFPDTTTPTIQTAIRITNEGTQAYEYQYMWCVTDSVANTCGGGDDVSSGSAAKLIATSTNFDKTVNSTVSTPGSYVFHLSASYGSATSTAHQTFTATAGNTPPTAVNDTATTTEDTAVNINVLLNDTDPDTGDTLSVTAVTQPSNGATSLVSGQVHYVPNAGFTGTDSFTYTVSDGTATDTGTVSVTVSQKPFKFTIDTTLGSNSTDKAFTIPVNPNFTGQYNYNVDCDADGTIEKTGATGNYTCTYGSVGIHTIAISGTFPAIYFKAYPIPFYLQQDDPEELTDITQWGSIQWQSMAYAFYSADYFATISAADTPDLSQVNDMSGMFYDASTFNADISSWDVSSVTNMSGMFYDASTFNTDISSWDVSSVTDMSQMFSYASAFNADISSWDVTSVTNMSGMFSRASAFNNNGVALDWGTTTAQVTNMLRMFRYASAFNADISSWDVSSVTDMSQMFQAAYVFNQDISFWDVSSVTNMSYMFSAAFAFNNNGVALNWGTTTAQVTDMSNMYFSASAFNADISSWDVGGVTDMSKMFSYASAFNADISSWDVSSLTNMSGMFHYASAFNQDLGSWDIGSTTDMTKMLEKTALTTSNYDATLIGWAGQNVQPNLTLGATGLTYCAGTSARQSLISSDGWTITDAGKICPNTPPTATNDTATTTEDTAVNINVLLNDTDPDTGDTLSVTAVTQPSNGATSVNANDTIKYTPNTSFTGTDSFTYTGSDGTATDTATVNVTITATNAAPTITSVADNPDPVTAGNDVTFTIDWSDADGDGVKTYICKTTAFTQGVGCDGGAFAKQSSTFSTTSPQVMTFSTSANATGTKSYWAYVEDSIGNVSSATTGAFTVVSFGGEPVCSGVCDSAVVTLNITSAISLSVVPTVVMNPPIGLTASKSVGSATMTVTTNSRSGYQLTVKASTSPALIDTGSSNTIPDYTEATPGVPETWSVESGSYEFGFSVVGTDAKSAYGTASGCESVATLGTTNLKYEGFDTTTVAVAEGNSITSASGTETTLCLAAEQNNAVIPSGTYSGIIVVTAIPI